MTVMGKARNVILVMTFYRAMHFSAKRGPSVRLSVTLRHPDHIHWNSWKAVTWMNSLGSSLPTYQTASLYSRGNISKFQMEEGWGRFQVAFTAEKA